MKRLDAWPDHKVTFGIAIAIGTVTLLGGLGGELDWSFWMSLLVTAAVIVIGVREKRRARPNGDAVPR